MLRVETAVQRCGIASCESHQMMSTFLHVCVHCCARPGAYASNIQGKQRMTVGDVNKILDELRDADVSVEGAKSGRDESR